MARHTTQLQLVDLANDRTVISKSTVYPVYRLVSSISNAASGGIDRLDSTPIDTNTQLVPICPMESVLLSFEGSGGYRRKAVDVGARSRSVLLSSTKYHVQRLSRL
jgi:hypothetical protein